MNLNQIADDVCLYISFKLNVEDIRKNTRLAEVVDARKIAYYILRKKYHLSYSSIGKVFNKNHATVMHNLKSVKGLLEYDIIFKEKFNDCVLNFDEQKSEIKVLLMLRDFKESMDQITETYEMLKKITNFNKNVLKFINTEQKYQQQWEKIIQH
jgi:hypothetical protein